MPANIKIGRASDQKRRGVNLVLYGAAGSGKTTAAADMADAPPELNIGENVYIIDAEGGASVVSDRDDIKVASVSDENKHGYATIDKLVDDIIAGKERWFDDKPIGTLIIDNLSEIKVMCLHHIVKTISRPNIKPQDRPDQNDWGKANGEMLGLCRKLRDFSRNSTTNVIFIAWELPEMNGDTVVRNAINLNPAFRRDFPGIVDCVGYLTVRGSKGVRQLSFAASNASDAKFRRNGSEIANTIPDVFRYKKEDKPLIDIIACLRADKPFPVAKYGKTPDSD